MRVTGGTNASSAFAAWNPDAVEESGALGGSADNSDVTSGNRSESQLPSPRR